MQETKDDVVKNTTYANIINKDDENLDKTAVSSDINGIKCIKT